MIELTDITREIYESSNRLKEGSREIFKLAAEKAEKERNYRSALAREIMRLKTLEGKEKVAATLIPDLARGNTADLKFERDLAEAKYIAGRQSLDAIQSQMTGLQSILKYQQEV